jgi:hypothetical protein
MNTYEVNRSVKRFELIMVLGFILGTTAVSTVLLRGEEPIGAMIFLSIWLFFVGKMIYEQCKKPTSIDLKMSEGKIRFYNRFISKEFNISELSLIDSTGSGEGLSFKFSKESVEISREIDKLHLLISMLVAENDNIRTAGC